uniref:Uncharacterized protein n=1 Tax=Megaselia scalaris TaxID=36166 RepID=T1GYJ4_MEGSC
MTKSSKSTGLLKQSGMSVYYFGRENPWTEEGFEKLFNISVVFRSTWKFHQMEEQTLFALQNNGKVPLTSPSDGIELSRDSSSDGILAEL